MASQGLMSTENNFTKGLITESTGLNFPENAATDTDNCEFTIVGDVTRRLGINNEINGVTQAVSRAGVAVSEYIWNNPGGLGDSKLLVKQVGGMLYFYDISAATDASPLSTQILSSTVTLSSYVAQGGVFDATAECQFSDGNGYLFVFNSTCDPFYCTYETGSIIATIITIQTRDFAGVPEPGVPVSLRPATLTDEHFYNLINQGWTSSNPWNANDTTSTQDVTVGLKTFTIPLGVSGIAGGQQVQVIANALLSGGLCMIGNVVSYTGANLVINVTSVYTFAGALAIVPGGTFIYPAIFGIAYKLLNWNIVPVSNGYISTWLSDIGSYPSNADVWWYFRDDTNSFDPSTTIDNVTLSTGNAPQGHNILNAFIQSRSAYATVTDTTTTSRPSTGVWYQGRVWYTGVSASQPATGDAAFYTWTENIYYSQTVESVADFGNCYQFNDPTSDTLNGELPTDGGVFSLVGSGTIHKLFPISNGLLAFANNGVWFITGSQGIGFASNDFTVTQISKIKVLSNSSFVDVNGLPFFWNEEGVYQVVPDKSGQLTVEPLTVGTILSYYNTIPLASKKFAKGAYDPINYVIQWVFKSTMETSVTDRYAYDQILNFNTYNKAFYPYTVSNTTDSINGIVYVSYPFIADATPEPGFKYVCSVSNTNQSFADENDETYVDWGSLDFISTFTTGYKVHGQGLRKFQVPYVNIFSRNISDYMAYYIQGLWDYAITTDSGQFSSKQLMEVFDINHGVNFKRPRIRGRGYTLQLKFTSLSGQPFDIIGWAVFENQNSGV